MLNAVLELMLRIGSLDVVPGEGARHPHTSLAVLRAKIGNRLGKIRRVVAWCFKESTLV